MADDAPDTEPRLTRQAISDEVGDLGWRYILGTLRASVGVTSLIEGAEVAFHIIQMIGGADDSLRIDLRADRIVLTLQSLSTAGVTSREITLARQITTEVRELAVPPRPSPAAREIADAYGLYDLPELWMTVDPEVGGSGPRSVQLIEIAIDAIDIASIRPFWRAVMGYADEPGATGPQDPIVDPVGQGPAIWFQQMDKPRPQRNRIHLDISVPHDEAEHRIKAALAAGGTLLSDAEAPSFWVLADAEGNEACVTTWQGRD